MAHNHGNEYQVKIVCEDGTEELSGWVNSEEQVAQAMAALHRPRIKASLLRERNALCPNCSDREQRMVEYPLANIPCPRYSPHDSDYLFAMGLINRYAAPALLPAVKVAAKPANASKKALVKKDAKSVAPKQAAKKASA